ncbi:mitotic regulator LTE1 [Aspergillus candidus]|uniref:Guanine nucleotide exchange factor n=1 Tax=Aspergillus candidus TaxID=41067 RepID=A0A2I2FD16_ASPCN|nr:hypothetical protein BDW47DRAFT_104979 [Aspergillus candidus]PLB38518.1 hypothetical protein BDW47DRAFT_104979 [Aspergillus candidus]
MELTSATRDFSHKKTVSTSADLPPPSAERDPNHANADPPYAAPSLRRAHTVAQGRTMGEKTTISIKAARDKMATSILRVKDSHELLRKRSFKRPDILRHPPRDGAAATAAAPATAPTKERHHFTVGNVGQNGKIFLRPIQNLPLREPRLPPLAPPLDQDSDESLRPHGNGTLGASNEPSRWSGSQLSELRPDLIPEESCEDADSIRSRSTRTGYNYSHHRLRRRAHSFSTISEQRSISRAGQSGEFGFTLNRADERPKSADGSIRSPLDVPVASDRLDALLLSDDGTALHDSIYSRLSDRYRVPHYLSDNWPSSLYVDGAGRPSFAASMFSGGQAIELAPTPAGPGNGVQYELQEPVGPSVFEDLVSEMDAESVVRYIPGTKDIGAATPARIVAQISSESFMDYELVSDFFLTFRSYLSPKSLLALLLARLQWAISRLQDDGRIIRIRTFAALRHWILNYYVDDFIPSYDLRTMFCETINNMYSDVKARENGGMSDLKILIDLKRCWYGKCSLYWEFQDQHITFQSPDLPIVPCGEGVLESNRAEDYPSLARAKSSHGIGLGEVERCSMTKHDRNGSAATAKSMPISGESDQSVQATSCSALPRPLQRVSMPHTGPKGPHPVPLAPLKPVTPVHGSPSVSPVLSRRYHFHCHAHKRSGSFSDSVRDDRAPFASLTHDHRSSSSVGALDLGGLIRGELYPPAESYMTMMAPPSPPLPSSTNSPGPARRGTSESMHKPTSSGSGVKTILGSIRRALNSRHGASQSLSGRFVNAPLNYAVRGKTSTLPANVAFGSDLYRDRKVAAASQKPVRIDVLCDETLHHYRRLMGCNHSKTSNPLHASTTSQQGSDLDFQPPNRQSTSAPGRERIRSDLTGGSESIVIVDDTGFGSALMSGAVVAEPAGMDESPDTQGAENPPTTPKAHLALRVPSHRSTLTGDEYSLPLFYEGSDYARASQASGLLHPLDIAKARRSLSMERASASWKRTSPSLRLRKYASFQSGIFRHKAVSGIGPESSISDQVSQSPQDRAAGPSLRRRPGGDLRQMRDGRGLPARAESGSFISDYSYRSSFVDSTVSRLRDAASRPQTSLIPPNPRFSLIQTNSSQEIRRSFEAAIAQFAQIPDDMDDDGGIESTLLKLEGKWGDTQETDDDGQRQSTRDEVARELEMIYRSHPHLRQDSRRGSGPGGWTHSAFPGENLSYSSARGRIIPRRPYSDSVADSEDSYSSIPLLERGLSDESMKRPGASQVVRPLVPPRTQPSDSFTRGTSDVDSSHKSYDFVKETESMRGIPRGSTLPAPVAQRPRYRAGRLSNLSSELSVDMIDPREAREQRLSIDTRTLSDSSLGIPPHPLAHPPSPPMTIQNPRSVISCATPLDPILFQAQPPTPDPSPHRNAEQANGRSIDVSGDIFSRSEMDRPHHGLSQAPGPSLDHVPFVLSCESQTLAQQLTLVEVAALSEVDWRDLVDMRWSSGSPAILNWAEFLASEEHRGIDLVVGRFNLMVKWVVSEIILTQDIHERALTITKFIHTAVHARRLCNYATVLQIAIALSSTDCSRLEETWALVPPGEKCLLKDMELLVQPVRNFHDLRVEMESANVQEGCIPFVGLYVHDLTYNAQKPAQIENRKGEPLVNFERHRTTAKIVKSLLRLIDASTKYNFEPVQGIVERCLWISALSEERIQNRSKQLC